MVVAAAVVAPSLPAAQPNRRPLHRRRRRSPPPAASDRRPPSARHRHHQPPRRRAPAAVPGIDVGAPPTSDDQPPPPLSPPQLPSSPPPPTTSCAPPSCCVVRSSAARLPRVVRPPTLVESSASSSPRAAPFASTPLVVSSVARPPRGNIATASLLRPPPPPSRSLRSVHCRLLHAASARTSPPPMSPQPYPRQRTKVSILAKKATAFATAMARLLAQGTLLGSSPPDGTAAAPPPPAIPARAAGRGGRGSHLCESDRSPPRWTSLPPRRQRASCRDDSRSPAAPVSPAPSRLAAATPTMCRGEGSPLAMKQSIRTASALSSSSVTKVLSLLTRQEKSEIAHGYRAKKSD